MAIVVQRKESREKTYLVEGVKHSTVVIWIKKNTAVIVDNKIHKTTVCKIIFTLLF